MVAEFPRGSKEPTQSPAKANVNTTNADPRNSHTQADIGGYGGGGTHGGQNRDQEANTADGRGSRQPTQAPQDTHALPDEPQEWVNGTGEVAPYGNAGAPSYGQGGVGGVDGSPDLPDFS